MVNKRISDIWNRLTRKKASKKNFWIVTGLFAGGVIALSALLIATTIGTSNAVYSFAEGDPREFSLPLKLSSVDVGDYTVSFTLNLSAIHPEQFRIIPDDCLDALDINGEPVIDVGLPMCDFTNGKVFDLGHYLNGGENTVVARVRNNGGDVQFVMQTSWRDVLLLVPSILIPLLIVLYTVYVIMRRKPAPWVTTLCVLFLIASFVRVFYMLSTPYWVRGHDTDGHIEYIDYIQENVRLPKPDEGWEYWQPPLYYAMNAVWTGSAELMELSRGTTLFGVQVISLLLSIATLGIIVWAGLRLFPDPKERSITLPVFFSAIAFFPGLVFLSARINNDALSVPLAFLAVALLLEWWRSGSRWMWYAVMGTIGLHILTKNNGLLLLPVVYGCLLFKPGFTWKKKIMEGAIGLAIVLLVAGWFSVYRTMHNTGQDMIIGNTGTLNSGLLLTNDIKNYVTFNPVKMLEIPFNNPWDDAARRQNFWEYWFRSAFFGEFQFGDSRKLMASWILFWAMTVGVIGLYGFIATPKNRTLQYLPMLLLAILLSLGHAAFRFKYPYGSSQDFRYSLVVLLPFALCVALGVLYARSALTRKSMIVALQAFCTFCIAFLLYP